MDKALATIATDRLRRAPLVQVAVLLSVLGAVMLNLVLAINHRAGRYMGVS